MREHIEGLIAAPYTAMHDDGGLNIGMIEKQAACLHRNGVSGGFVCGTTGQSMSLTEQERIDVAREWARVAPDGFKVIVHVGHDSVEAARAFAAHAQEIGAWGIGAMGPSFFKPRAISDLVAYCSEVAAAAPDLPFYYYHLPSMTGINFKMIDFLEAAGGIPNLAGIKYTHADVMDFNLCRRFEGGRFDLLFGRDEMLICGLALGARGAIGSTYNYASPLYLRIIEAFDAGDLETARSLQMKSMQLVNILRRTESSFAAAAKSIMKMLGIDCGPVRTPLRKITQQQYEDLKAELDEIGFFEFCSK